MAPMTWTLWCSHDKIRKGQWWPFATDLTEDEAVAQVTYRSARVKPECRFQALPAGETP